MVEILETNLLVAQIDRQAVSPLEGYSRRNQTFLQSHSDFDDFIDKFVTAGEVAEAPGANRSAIAANKEYLRVEKLLAGTRIELMKVLWAHDVFLSSGTVDRILFYLASKSTGGDIVKEFFDFVLVRKLHNTGFVLYPIHSFGIQGFGLAGLMKLTIPDVDLREAGVFLSAQTNNVERTLAFLDRARLAFGISHPLPGSLRSEFMREHFAWTTKNPLLALKMSSTTSGFYENQFVIMVKLQLATALVQMLATLGQTDRTNRESRNLSTARTNNYETLDFNHYVVFEANEAKPELDPLRTPMNVSRSDLVSLAEMNIDIDPSSWSDPEKQAILSQIQHGLGALEAGYLSEWVLGEKTSTRARVLRKVFLSVSYFHKSFRSAINTDEAVVSIAIAFETLLTDGYQRGGVKNRIARRVPLCLANDPDRSDFVREVQKLMEYRGQVVHEGTSDISIDINAVRRAYVRCFLAVMACLPNIKQGASQPVGDVLGDVTPKRSRWKVLRQWIARKIDR